MPSPDAFGSSRGLEFIRSPGLERDRDTLAELFFWTAGNLSDFPPVSAAQPFEPENFFRVNAQGRSLDQPDVIPELPEGNPNLRYTFAFTGIWQASPIGIWEVLSGQALNDILPRRSFILPPIPPELSFHRDYALPIFLLSQRLPLIPMLSPFGGVLINSIPGVPLNDLVSYRFDRIIDVRPNQVPDPIVGNTPYNVISRGEFPLNQDLAFTIFTRDDNFREWTIDRRNTGCPLTGLNLPGLPPEPQAFTKGVNVRFIGTYLSLDHTPLLIRDNVGPTPCSQ